MMLHSLLRAAEHKALETVTLSGSVLDLGGDRGAEYLSHIKGTFTVTAVNLDAASKPDIFHDLEKPLPIPDASYDHVLLINVLEHIYSYEQLLAEAHRIVKPGGSVIIIVPFLFPIHPSPQDFWRFSHETLSRLLGEQGLAEIQIEALGSGVFAARFVLLDRLLPHPLRLLNHVICRPFVSLFDRAFAALAYSLGKKYTPKEYPLGYLVTATRPV